MHFADALVAEQREKESILVCGLDPQLSMLPRAFCRAFGDELYHPYEMTMHALSEYLAPIIPAVAPYACAFKINTASLEPYGGYGMWALEDTMRRVRETGRLCILDAKRGDGGDSAKAYAYGHLAGPSVILPDGVLGRMEDGSSWETPHQVCDAMTVETWIGEASLKHYFDAARETGKGIFVVARTSFRPDSMFETLVLKGGRRRAWEVLAEALEEWSRGTQGPESGYRNIGAVMAATKAEDATRMRQLLPDSLFLVPGFGAQGGGADGAVMGVNTDGLGCLVNSSRDIIAAWQKGPFAVAEENGMPDFAGIAARAAQHARDALNAALARAGKCAW